MGFSGPEQGSLVQALDQSLNDAGAITTDASGMTSRAAAFAAGDARHGQSLIFWAISEGREMAYQVDRHLMSASSLPQKGCCDLPRV